MRSIKTASVLTVDMGANFPRGNPKCSITNVIPPFPSEAQKFPTSRRRNRCFTRIRFRSEVLRPTDSRCAKSLPARFFMEEKSAILVLGVADRPGALKTTGRALSCTLTLTVLLVSERDIYQRTCQSTKWETLQVQVFQVVESQRSWEEIAWEF